MTKEPQKLLSSSWLSNATASTASTAAEESTPSPRSVSLHQGSSFIPLSTLTSSTPSDNKTSSNTREGRMSNSRRGFLSFRSSTTTKRTFSSRDGTNAINPNSSLVDSADLRNNEGGSASDNTSLTGTENDESGASSASNSHTRWEWRMNYDDLPALPQFPSWVLSSSHKSTTSVQVNNIPLDVVLQRLSTFLRLKSITCDFQPTQGLIRCVTPRHTHFVVMFWKGELDNTSDAKDEAAVVPQMHGQLHQPLVVGVERRQGCCIEMHRLRKILKETIELGAEPSPEPVDKCGAVPKATDLLCHTIGPLIKKLYQQRHPLPPPELSQDFSTKSISSSLTGVTSTSATTTASSAASSEDDGRNMERRKSSFEGLSSCLTLLQSTCEDRQRLGLESLVSLTDCTATGVDPETAWDATQALLQLPQWTDGKGDEYEEDLSSLQDSLLRYFTHLDGLCLFDDEAVESVEIMEGHQLSVLHSLALESLTHALEVVVQRQASSCHNNTTTVADDASVVPVVRLDLDSEFWRTIIRAIWFNIAQAVSRPQDAALSAKCLSLLEDLKANTTCTTSSLSTRLMGSLPNERSWLIQILIRANDYGAAHHLMLEQETKRLLDIFDVRQSSAP